MATVLAEQVTDTQQLSRPERILARQQNTELFESDLWRGYDDLSLVAEDPSLATEPLIVRKALAERWLLMNMPIRIDPDDPRFYGFRGYAYWTQGLREKAEADYARDKQLRLRAEAE